MQLTKEHHKWIGECIPLERTSAEKAHWISGASEAIEKFGGIQWNKYPESEPPAKGELLVLEPDGTLHLCGWRSAYNVFEVQGKKESPEGWQWAEINLPNQ